MSARRGLRALALSRLTLPGVSSPDSVVRSMSVIARASHAACHSFFTVRRVGMVAVLRSTALRFTWIARTTSRSSGTPGFRSTWSAGTLGRGTIAGPDVRAVTAEAAAAPSACTCWRRLRFALMCDFRERGLLESAAVDAREALKM
jgi:hypothetical protein